MLSWNYLEVRQLCHGLSTDDIDMSIQCLLYYVKSCCYFDVIMYYHMCVCVGEGGVV